jgi:hypothetical protein
VRRGENHELPLFLFQKNFKIRVSENFLLTLLLQVFLCVAMFATTRTGNARVIPVKGKFVVKEPSEKEKTKTTCKRQ